ncbi:probable E3 ubiquitin-protein ligase ZFP1 [Solanum dulcamara]|uniref:probable E3 ubiquitin-protein ligase ZFP1 n=1 Tax=Solanum dulcamara TaxID=45834 RepID=UPI00248682BC|nr:probable E3 ubiquitin-protein ligase ZFP1 [Solanum dulcamara]XP_055823442.1 probable E3 ubiquitin-protein ligase ZFP1 [Solanum dulcamara]XP_055823443.1 probable E3 ubiquitin-protein ligase ZFP1 [Solanum dulcamara]
MGERSRSHSNHFMDLGADQPSQAYIYPEPCMMYGSFTAFPHPNVHSIVPAPGNIGNFYVPHLPGHLEGALIYGMPPANGTQQWHHLTSVGAAFAPPSNYFYPYVAAPSSSTAFPFPVNHGLRDGVPVSGTQGSVGNNANNLDRNDPRMDSTRGSAKQKSVERNSGNLHHSDVAGPSTSAASVITTAHESGASSSDVSREHGGSDSETLLENAAPSASTDLPFPVDHGLRDGLPVSGTTEDSVSREDGGNYVGQSYQFPGNPWLNMPFHSSSSVAQPWAWSQAAPLPYLPGGAGGYVLGAGNMGMQGYQVPSSNGGLTSFMYPPIPQGPPQYHAHLPPNMQSMVGHTMSSPPQMTASPGRQLQLSSSNMGPLLPSGFRMYRPHQREFIRGTNTSHHNLPNGVAMLGVPGFRGVGVVIDQHRDMRLDVDRMSYEELLALGERIGNVNTGLSEEFIVTNMKTRIFLSTETLESVAAQDQKTVCVICQTDYKDHEKIGILDCGHEYHEDCIKKWLVVKNSCAICKSTALSTEKKDKDVVNTGGD